ncbi:MAG: hypothetical protein ACTSXT_13770 [Candidatus Helarchaeota archaeon]
MIKLKTNREYTFPIPNEKEASVTFKFEYSEEKDYSQVSNIMRKAISSKNNMKEDELIKKVEGEVAASYQNIQYASMRKCLIACEGFEDELGKKIIIIENKKVNELAQKVVFEFVKNIPELYEKIELAQNNVQIKN